MYVLYSLSKIEILSIFMVVETAVDNGTLFSETMTHGS